MHITRRCGCSPTKRSSWASSAEVEIRAFERGCLSRSVPDIAALVRRVQALETEHNQRRTTSDWQLTARQARVKLKNLYPVVKS